MASSKLVMVPNGEVRSTTLAEKGQRFATIHTGKFRIVGDVGEDGRVRIDSETFNEIFEVVDEDEKLPAGA